MPIKYKELTEKEYDLAIIKMIEELDKPLKTAGVHRKKDWERGWKEAGKFPQYFGKYNIHRLKGKLVKGISKNYEREALYSVLDPLIKKYLWNKSIVYEFGCGTGHNLLRLSPHTNTVGFDWANPLFEYFDFFKPGRSIVPNSGVYTVAALEQVGTNFKPFVSYLLKQKPSIVVHVEPIEELLDPRNLLDYLSLRYMKKRKYLSGYLTYLRKLEKSGKIKIIEARRSGIGSMFIDGYSIIAWKPN